MRLCLLICCLILTRTEANNAEDNDQSTEKPPMDGEELLNIQNQLLEIQDDVISITKAIGQAENLDSIIKKFEVTEESFKLVQDKLANNHAETTGCSESAMTMLDNLYEAVNAHLKNLKTNFKDFEQKLLSSETIADIKEHKFNSVQDKLKQQQSFSDVLKIVQEVYEYSSDNFNLLANFTESLTDIDMVYNFVKALQQEISVNKTVDPYKLMRLVKIMETGVINKEIVDASTKSSAQDVVSKLYQSIREYTLNALKTSASKGAFERNGELDNLTQAIYAFDPNLSESAIEDFVHTTYELEYLRHIFDTIVSHKFILQRIKGINVLFWKMKDSFKINNDVILNIASALYKIHSDDEYKTLDRSVQMAVERIIDALPTCARNLFFLPSVCLWNKGKEEYLTAGNSTYKNDELRRNIFTSEDPLPGSHWIVETIGDNFLFSSRSFPDEYLYAADFKLNSDLRYLFNWIPGNNTDRQSKWTIRLDHEYCYIQSARFYEYMIASKYQSQEDEDMKLNYAFIWSPRTPIYYSEFEWQIRKCD